MKAAILNFPLPFKSHNFRLKFHWSAECYRTGVVLVMDSVMLIDDEEIGCSMFFFIIRSIGLKCGLSVVT